MNAIETSGLTKRFSAEHGVITAVDGLDLTVEKGIVFGLLGPNGSGKTTTINMLTGLWKPTSGQARVLGLDPTTEPLKLRARLGVVPQETALYERLTPWNNLSLHAALYHMDPAEAKRRIAEVLDLVQLTPRAHSRVSAFSGGMKRRLALARAILTRPELLILDEPTIGVDVQGQNAIWERIADLRQQGVTILLTTNYMQEAEVLCDYVAIIDHGRIVVEGTPAELKSSIGGDIIELRLRGARLEAVRQALQGISGVVDVAGDGLFRLTTHYGERVLPQVITALDGVAPVEEVALRRPSLGDVFLQLTGRALRD